MGDSWDETSLEVSEAVSRTDDLDADLFGSLSPKKGPSLLQAMKNKTGKGIFDEQEVKPKPAEAAPVIRNTPASATKQAVKTPKSPDDDLLADLLSESDYSEISNRKPVPSKTPPSKTHAAVSTPPAKFNNPVSTPPVAGRARGAGGGGTTPNRGGGGGTPNRNPGGKPQDKGLFDDDDDLSGMLDSEPIAPPSRTGSRNNKPAPAAGNTKPAGKPASAPGTNKFSDLLSRTSLMKEGEDPVRASTAPGRRTMDQQQAAPSTPQRGTGPRGGGSGGGILDDSIGFTPR
eukprot:sb/3467705/